MTFLLDTHLLLWAAGEPHRLSAAALGRTDFVVDPRRLRRGLLDNGYQESPVRSEHAVAVADLPPLHRDPFDRLLVAQARIEGATLLTADDAVAAYPGAILRV